jgi:hypothetical protein
MLIDAAMRILLRFSRLGQGALDGMGWLETRFNLHGVQVVGGSNPLAPTNRNKHLAYNLNLG